MSDAATDGLHLLSHVFLYLGGLFVGWWHWGRKWRFKLTRRPADSQETSSE